MMALALQPPHLPAQQGQEAPLRCVRERILQTVAFEAGGLMLASPLYSVVFGTSLDGSVVLLGVLAAACLIWSPVHNTTFDWFDHCRQPPATARSVGAPSTRCRTK